jgi:hypothetical protein
MPTVSLPHTCTFRYPQPSDGNGVPEQFWNCAKVNIVYGEDPPTTPVASPDPIAPVQTTTVTSTPVWYPPVVQVNTKYYSTSWSDGTFKDPDAEGGGTLLLLYFTLVSNGWILPEMFRTITAYRLNYMKLTLTFMVSSYHSTCIFDSNSPPPIVHTQFNSPRAVWYAMP